MEFQSQGVYNCAKAEAIILYYVILGIWASKRTYTVPAELVRAV
jgi:hypothetical protein